jgi:hypothetical protein
MPKSSFKTSARASEMNAEIKPIQEDRITKSTAVPIQAHSDLDLTELVNFLKEGELTEKRRIILECTGSPGRSSYIVFENTDMNKLFKKESFSFVVVMAFSLKNDPNCAFYFAIEDKKTSEFIFIGDEYRLKFDKRMPVVNDFMNAMFEDYTKAVEKILQLVNAPIDFNKLSLKMINTRLASPFFSVGNYKIDKKTINHKMKLDHKSNAENLFSTYNGIIKATGETWYKVTNPKGVQSNSNIGIINHTGRLHQLRIALSKDISSF